MELIFDYVLQGNFDIDVFNGNFNFSIVKQAVEAALPFDYYSIYKYLNNVIYCVLYHYYRITIELFLT